LNVMEEMGNLQREVRLISLTRKGYDAFLTPIGSGALLKESL